MRTIELDARAMDPPEPLVRTVAALEALGAGDRLRLRVRHEPHPLYRILRNDGFDWRTTIDPVEGVEVLIWRHDGSR